MAASAARVCVCARVCVKVLVVDASLCDRRIRNVGILLGGLCFASSGSSFGDPEVAWGRILGSQLRVVVRLGLIEINELGLGIENWILEVSCGGLERGFCRIGKDGGEFYTVSEIEERDITCLVVQIAHPKRVIVD